MNRQPYPIPSMTYSYDRRPTQNITVIPQVRGRFRVIDYGRPPNRRRYVKDIRILPAVPQTLSFNTNILRTQSLNNMIKQQLTQLIEEAVQVGIDNDINLITGEYENSPPIKIEPDEINRLPTILGGGNATFTIVRLNNNVIQGGFGQERVFKSAPPELYYDKTKYFEPSKKSILLTPTGEEATCGYQYIYEQFHNRAGFKKLSKDYQTIKYWSRKTPPQYQTWLKHYSREINIKKLDLNIQHAGDIEIETFETDLYKVQVVDLEEEDDFSKEDIERSMSVLDIVRWCMWAKINCYVIDFDGHYYMTYNHKQITEQHADKKPKTTSHSIVVKVKNNHAYFVEDADLKKAVNLRYSKWLTNDFEEIGSKAKDLNNEYDVEVLKDGEVNTNKFWIHPYHVIKAQAENYGMYQACQELGVNKQHPEWDTTLVDSVINFDEKGAYVKNNPPPLPTELLDDSGKTFYMGEDKLNGLVSYLYHNHNVLPDRMNGSSGHKIDRVTYGKNKIMSRQTLPTYTSDLPTEELQENIQGLYPDLPVNYMPTAKKLADEVFKVHYNTIEQDGRIYSMFNSNTRRVFYDAEIKPANQVYLENVSESVHSVDIRQAYTTALENYDLDFNVYDAVCQFKKYDGNFNPNYFYLVEEIGSGYPLKDVKDGWVLYHGCMLRHLLGKGLVVIKKVIKPVTTLSPDYFNKFISKCNELENTTGGEIPTKRLVNTWVGGLKKPDKINHFKFNTTESESTITRAFYRGEIISLLDENTKFNVDYRFNQKPLYMISHPNGEHNIQSGQPIRLAVIEKVSEMLYKVHQVIKSCLWFAGRLGNNTNTQLAMTRTDALYYQGDTPVLDTDPHYAEFLTRYTGFEVRFERWIDEEDWNGYFKKYKPQPVVRQKRNQWSNVIDVNQRWSKKIGATLLFRLLNSLGGGWVQGEGGVGKTEFLLNFKNIVEENCRTYKWLRLIYKLKNNYKHFELLEQYRDVNPCNVKLLAPTNKACNNIGGATLNKGLGIPVLDVDEDELEGENVSYFDKITSKLAGDGYKKHSCDYVVVDEISMMNGMWWSLLYSIKRRIPRIKFILCGDIKRQLPPVGEEWRDFDNAYVVKELAGFNLFNFNYNFRNGLSGNILWDDWSINPQRFKVVSNNPDTEKNLCYTNAKRKEVINKFEVDIVNSGLPYLKLEKLWGEEEPSERRLERFYQPDGHSKQLIITYGTPLIAFKNNRDYGISKNESRKVISWDREFITLDDNIEYDYQFIYDNFLSGYCITIHKCQGDTYKEKYTIHEWNRLSGSRSDSYIQKRFKRKLRYVAQSRSVDPENNIYYN